jgi:hypothetical protein
VAGAFEFGKEIMGSINAGNLLTENLLASQKVPCSMASF